MESPVRTSFIPQQGPKSPFPQRKRPGTVGLVTIISVVVFVAALVASGGLFFYKQYLENTLQEKITSLENAKGAFDPVLLEELSRLDTRINSAKQLLASHTSLSQLFDFLEKFTLQTVRFRDFSFGAGPSEGTYVMRLEGQAASFASVALQADEYGKSELFSESKFGSLNVDENGLVTFNVDSLIASNNLLFSKTIGSSPDTVTTTGDITRDITSSASDSGTSGGLMTGEAELGGGVDNATTP